jgi:hypothetical protein
MHVISRNGFDLLDISINILCKTEKNNSDYDDDGDDDEDDEGDNNSNNNSILYLFRCLLNSPKANYKASMNDERNETNTRKKNTVSFII